MLLYIRLNHCDARGHDNTTKTTIRYGRKTVFIFVVASSKRHPHKPSATSFGHMSSYRSHGAVGEKGRKKTRHNSYLQTPKKNIVVCNEKQGVL